MILIHIRLSGSLYYLRYSFHYFLSEQKIELAFTNLTKKGHLNLCLLITRAQHIEATSWKTVILNGAWPKRQQQETAHSWECSVQISFPVSYTQPCFSPMPPAALSWGLEITVHPSVSEHTFFFHSSFCPRI